MAEVVIARTGRNQDDSGLRNRDQVGDKRVRGPQALAQGDEDHVVRGRQPLRTRQRPNDLYVTSHSSYQRVLDKCHKLLEGGETEVFVHGLGGAVNRAVNLALQLESEFVGRVQLIVNTSTTTYIDDLEPLHDQATYSFQTRQNSGIHICIKRVARAQN